MYGMIILITKQKLIQNTSSETQKLIILQYAQPKHSMVPS